MKFQLEEYHRGITDEELIADLKLVALELNKTSVTQAENKERGKYGTTTHIRRFGSWYKAMEKAGLQKTRTPMNLPEEELYKNLEEVWIKLGRQPRYLELHKPISKYHVGTYEYRFGTWRKALEKFVAYINNEENTSSEEAIKKLKFEPSTKHKTSRTINWRLRFIVMRQDNFKCKNCGRSPATDPSIILHVDHIKAWVNGGETILGNLQTLCSVCNIGKSNLDQEEKNKTQGDNLGRGGNGGQVFIITEKMSGDGSISVDGGAGKIGGNAGKIHIESKVNNYAGKISAKGGKSSSNN